VRGGHGVPGDEVFYTPEPFGNPHGTYAEYAVVPETIVDRKPARLSTARTRSPRTAFTIRACTSMPANARPPETASECV
jgi:NADPH:quinone reductase-like Zn-dependent oxidoreductase